MLSEQVLRLVQKSQACVTIASPDLPDTPIVAANHAFFKLTGYSQEETLGRNCRFLQSEERPQIAASTMRDTIRERGYCDVTVKNFKKSGEPFTNQIYLSTVRASQNGPILLIGMQFDISHEIDPDSIDTAGVRTSGETHSTVLTKHELLARQRNALSSAFALAVQSCLITTQTLAHVAQRS
ncbi:MAG: PAS domain-containing protein [Burkholderiaceae bacterium]